MAKIKFEVVKEDCIGCGTCTAIAPDLFEINEDGHVHPKAETTEDEELIKNAIESCPNGAIKIKE